MKTLKKTAPIASNYGDFEVIYCKETKRNYWLMGYMGDGSVSVTRAYEIAKEYVEMHNVPLESIYIDEVLNSRRYKHYKFFSSNCGQEPIEEAFVSENAYKLMTD